MFDRRGIITLLSVPLLDGLKGSHATAAPSMVEATLPDVPPSDPPVRRTWISPPNCYFTYPHSNGFLPNGNPVVGQIAEDGHGLTYLEWDFRSGETRPLFITTTNNMYWDIAERTGDLVAQQNRASIVAVTTRGTPKSETILQINASRSARLEDLISINAAGENVLYAVEKSDNDPAHIRAADLFELDRATGTSTRLAALPFDADHPHFCPHNEAWIGFSHEGDISKSLDRIWGLNRDVNGGVPARMWDETLAHDGVGYVGHERWAFHMTGAVAVVYPPTTKQGTLISASDYDWHCNINRAGSWAVVDTFRPPRRPTEADGRTITDVVLVDVATGGRLVLAKSHRHPLHPWHPHPHFTPDGRYIIYNDYQRDRAGGPSYTVVLELALPL
jgi:hypothetical protein